jgi:hypothetical protein
MTEFSVLDESIYSKKIGSEPLSFEILSGELSIFKKAGD